MIEITPTPVEHFTDLVNSADPFTFTRWGDGEWQAVLGRTHDTNCDGHHYFPDMGRELREVLLESHATTQLLGMQPLAAQMFDREIFEFCADAALQDWHDADVFHWAISHEDRYDAFRGFLDALRSRYLVVVGPGHMREPLQKLLGYRTFVEVPPVDCYLALDAVLDDLVWALPGEGYRAAVSVSFSMPAAVLIDRASRQRPEHAYIDMGSVWDPYCGVTSRSYMTLPGWQPPR